MKSFAEISPQVQGTDFLHLRLTNAASTSHDSALIRNIISLIDNDISEVDQSIAALKVELEHLKTKRGAHVERRSSYSRLISPLRSIPLEILGEIFLYASSDLLSFRLNVSHVCRLWRNAALTCSEMWSILDGRFPKIKQRLQEYIHVCVQRARSRPITLITRGRLDYDMLSAILDATGTCSWKEFSWALNLKQEHFGRLIQSLTSTSHDTLQSLSLKAYWNTAMPQITVTVSDLKPFTRLSRLTMSQSKLVGIRIIDAPWSQLTHLSLTFSESDEDILLDIIRQCLNLEECSIDISFYSEDTSRHRPIHLANLRKLHLSNSEQLFTSFTRVLVTPALEELVIYCSDELEWDVTHNPCLYRYLEANAQTLRRLWICGLSGTEVADTIIDLKFLEELTLGGNENMRDDAFDALTVYYGDSSTVYVVPLPHLRAITIICEVNSVIQQAFVDLVESRWWSDGDVIDMQDRSLTCRLRYASLQEKIPDTLLNNFNNIEKYEREGLDINMLNASSDDFKPRFCNGS